jgi:ankyrin repeat protein
LHQRVPEDASEDPGEFSPDWKGKIVPLECDSEIVMPLKYYTTAVNIAALYAHLEVVKFLTRPTIRSTITQDVDRTCGALLYLSAFGEVLTLRNLLEYHKEFDLPKYFGSLFISAAAYAGNHECLEHLLQAGLSPYPKNPNGMAPLLWAARYGHTRCVDLLMEHQIPDKDCTHFDSHEATPIMDAARNGHLDCVRVLLRYKVSLEPLHQPGSNALHCAVDSGNLAIIEELVKAGIDVNSLDSHGWTPLMCSLFVQEWGWGEVFQPRQYLIRKLISLGADPTINDIAEVLKERGHEAAIPWLKKG